MIRSCRDNVKSGSYDRVSDLRRGSELGIALPLALVGGQDGLLVDDLHINVGNVVLDPGIDIVIVDHSVRRIALFVDHVIVVEIVAHGNDADILGLFYGDLAFECLSVHRRGDRGLSDRTRKELAVLGNLYDLGIARLPLELAQHAVDPEPALRTELKSELCRAEHRILERIGL